MYDDGGVDGRGGRRFLGFFGAAAAEWQRVGDPVDDVEEQERRRKTLARHFVDASRSSLARFDVNCYRVLLPVRTPGTVQPLCHTVHQQSLQSSLELQLKLFYFFISNK